jgi:peptidoglycan/LPS O-acetylase OafA/YrhL
VAKRHIHALTGVRGIASFWVLLHHTPNLHREVEFHIPYVGNLFDKGWLGVDLFFVLSGFVISYVYGAKMRTFSWPAALRFWKLRVARIYPAHVVATLAFAPVYLGAHFAFGYVSPNDAFSVTKLLHALTLTNGWGIPNATGWNMPSWSVSSEWAAYLAFPLIVPLTGRNRSLALNTGGIVAIIAAMLGLAFWQNGGTSYTLQWEWTLLRIASEFLIGCLIYDMFRELSGRDERPIYDWIAGGSLMAIAGLSLWGLPSIYDFVLILLFATLVLSLALSNGPIARWFGGRALVYLGEISYSIYLIHTVILLVMGQALKRFWTDASTVPTAGFMAAYLVFIGVSILAGHLLFRFIEEPARKWLRAKWVK